MSDKAKVKIALAEAITTQLWVRGYITDTQRDKIIQKSRNKLEKTDC